VICTHAIAGLLFGKTRAVGEKTAPSARIRKRSVLEKIQYLASTRSSSAVLVHVELDQRSLAAKVETCPAFHYGGLGRPGVRARREIGGVGGCGRGDRDDGGSDRRFIGFSRRIGMVRVAGLDRMSN